ncbi:unnamed protein product [Polarella glacialis]|uniref:Uncharacterized protein n=1 Tax=Polarella glacialis TaxID=89957 RepID=A0A813F7D3_POLGL|nr:unnamed protein product [Polarella glacialis]
MPNSLMATKLWVSESIATGGMLQVVVSAWQAYTESWRATTVGIQDKWEATQNQEAIPTNIMPLEDFNTPTLIRTPGRPDRVAANWSLKQALGRRFSRWRVITPSLATMHRILAQWRWLVSVTQQAAYFVELAKISFDEIELLREQGGEARHIKGRLGAGSGVKRKEGSDFRVIPAYGNSEHTTRLCSQHGRNESRGGFRRESFDPDMFIDQDKWIFERFRRNQDMEELLEYHGNGLDNTAVNDAIFDGSFQGETRTPCPTLRYAHTLPSEASCYQDVSILSLPIWKKRVYRDGGILHCLAIDVQRSVDVDATGVLLAYRLPRTERVLIETLSMIQAFDLQCPCIMRVITGFVGLSILPPLTVFTTFATLMIIRHTSFWENGGLYADIADHNMAGAIRDVLQEIFKTILGELRRLIGAAGSNLLHRPQESLPNQALESVRDTYRGEDIEVKFLTPLIEFMWNRRLDIMNQEQIIAMVDYFRTVPPSLIDDHFKCTYQRFWKVTAIAQLEHSIEGIILVSTATRWDPHSRDSTHEVYKALRMIIQIRLLLLIEGSRGRFPFQHIELDTLLAALSDDVTYNDWAQWWHPLLPHAMSYDARADLSGSTGSYIWSRNFPRGPDLSNPRDAA